MKNNGLFFTRNDCRQAAARENMKLKAEIHQTQHKMVWLRYQFLLRRFKLLEQLDF